MSKSFVFVRSVAEWEAVQQHYPVVATSCIPLTTDLQVAHGLERDGRPFLELWDYLVATDQAEIRRLAFALLDWHQPYLGAIRHHGICLAELMKFDLFSTFAIWLVMERAFRRLLQEHPAQRIAFFATFERTQYGAGGIDSDVPEAVLAWLADQAGMDKVLLRRVEQRNGVYWHRNGKQSRNAVAASS